jgi:periplasmic divalent cation tolerance protein
MSKGEPLVVFVTAASMEEAEALASALLEARVAACVSILPGVESRFWWEGRIERAQEVLLVIKTLREAYPTLERTVTTCHSYQVPEILALPVVQGHLPYLSWIMDNVER